MNEDNTVELKFKDEIEQEEFQKFYEENQDAVDMLGGLDMFESLMELEDDQFKELYPMMLQVFNETLNDKANEAEIIAMALTAEGGIDSIREEYEEIVKLIDEMDFISEIKKDFLKEVMMLSFNRMSSILNKEAPIVQIPCELEEGVKLPVYAHDTDAGLDIYAREEITIGPGETVIVHTGIKCAIPEGYALLIQPRSGQSAKTKLRIANTPGLIDSGYRDEIGVIIENIEPPFKDIDYSFDTNGEVHIHSILHGSAYTIAPGQRFAQMRLVQVPRANFTQVESVGEIGENRGGGFGSSGLM